MPYAEGSTGSGFDPLYFINFGVLGIVVAAAIFGLIWFKPSIDNVIEEKDRAVADREKAEAQRDAAMQVLQDKLLPVVNDFVNTTRALLPILQQIQQLQQTIPILQEIIRSGYYAPPQPPQQAKPRRQRPPPDAGAGGRANRKGK